MPPPKAWRVQGTYNTKRRAAAAPKSGNTSHGTHDVLARLDACGQMCAPDGNRQLSFEAASLRAHLQKLHHVGVVEALQDGYLPHEFVSLG